MARLRHHPGGGHRRRRDRHRRGERLGSLGRRHRLTRDAAEPPATRYARAGAVSIAYQVHGEGSPELLLALGYGSHQDLQWEEPRLAYFLRRLAALGCLLTFDKRGTGLSDRLESEPTLEMRSQDFHAVLDAEGIERATVIATTGGGPPAVYFAATAPERVERLVLYNVPPRLREADDYPWGLSDEVRQFLLDALAEGMWGTGRTVDLYAPSLRDDVQFVNWQARYERSMASPRSAELMVAINFNHDVRDLLSSIAAPTLVLCRPAPSSNTLDAARWTAAQIPDSRLVELPAGDSYPFVGDSESVLRAIESFVEAERRPVALSTRVVKTVLFTDLVASTTIATDLGDRAWRALLESHDAIVRTELSRHDGTEVKSTGDGVLATFDGPARAVHCALAIRTTLATIGLDSRAGLHTGEIELRDDDIAGIAVHLAARVAALAGAGEVLATATVRDLTYGSELVFADLGPRDLRGIGTWNLVRVETA